MKIENIKINGFGKINNKEINFTDKINLIKGDNESGKSMIMSYLRAMFFGLQKTRKRGFLSDEEKFKPWNTHEFSGQITYTLNDGTKYTCFRDFNTGKVSVFDGNNNEITAKYGMDREVGVKYIEEQTGLDLRSFDYTMFTMQNSVVLNAEDKNIMVQRLSNLVTTGEDNLSYKMIQKKMQDKKREEVGSNKTLNMPINIVEKKIISSKEEIDRIKEKSLEPANSSEKELEIKRAFAEAEDKKKIISILKEENYQRKTNDQMLFSLREKLTSKKDKIQEKRLQKHDLITPISIFELNKKTFITIFVIAAILEIITITLGFTIYKNTNMMKRILLMSAIPVLTAVISLCIYIKHKKELDRDIEERSQENRDLEKEINIIRKDIKEEEKEIEKYEKKKLADEKLFNEMVIADFCGKLSDDYLNKVLEMNEQELKKQEDIVDNQYTVALHQLSTIDAKKVIANKDLEKLATLEEHLNNLEEEKKELSNLGEVYDIILDGLDVAYNKMKESISPSFINNLSKITSQITNGKYKSVILSEDQDILVKLETGEYVSLKKLSVGTIEQINLALRISILNELTNENMPIFLDESFVFYDCNRLNNIINILNNNFNRQIIICSCSDREKEMLDKNNIVYNYITI